MVSEDLMKEMKDQSDRTYGKYCSVMPRALKGMLEEHINNDSELSENEDRIKDVHSYMEMKLIDKLWDALGDSIEEISNEAKQEYQLGDYRPTEDELRFSDREQEYRDEGL
jgi:hypothetical protein